MTTIQENANRIYLKTQEVMQDVLKFSETIQHTELIQIKTYLSDIARTAPATLLQSMNQERRIDRMRAIIITETYLQEAKDYLNLIERLRFGTTKDLVGRVEELSKMLAEVA